ncbi:MAG: hypothetical protein J6A09_04185 [Alphaproteobacteria bacterium]|nr:hypothetical protein [Alphaproteobacteria bacterium]
MGKKKSRKIANSYFWTMFGLFGGVGMTVASLLGLPIVLTDDKFLVGMTVSGVLLGLVLYLLGVLSALYEGDYYLKESAKGCGVVLLMSVVSMTVCGVMFSIMGKDLSGSVFFIAEWGSFIAGSVTVAVLHYRKA